MTAVTDRPLRADAARNAERILKAARAVYGELGPDAPLHFTETKNVFIAVKEV